MSDPNEEDEQGDQDGTQPEQPRDNRGRFTSKTRSDQNGGSQPTDSEYTKINSILAKQLGITDRLADYQTKHDPRDLFKMLEFMAENSDNKGNGGSTALSPNQNFVPVSPEPSKIDLPGVVWHDKPNLSEGKFSASFHMSARDLLKAKKEE